MENMECLICYAQAQNPSICAQCSKVFCDACLQTHFTRNTRTCPHCRASVGQVANGFVNVKWLPELIENLGGTSVAAKFETCQSHRPKQKTIFCSDCKFTCCLDCVKADHLNHQLAAVELAHYAMGEILSSLKDDVDFANKLVVDFKSQSDKIEALREEGRRRIATLAEDLRRRLDVQIDGRQAYLKQSRPNLCTFMNSASPIMETINSRSSDPTLNRLLDVTSTFNELTQLVDDAIAESEDDRSSYDLPDSLPMIPIPQNWL